MLSNRPADAAAQPGLSRACPARQNRKPSHFQRVARVDDRLVQDDCMGWRTAASLSAFAVRMNATLVTLGRGLETRAANRLVLS